MDYKELNEEAKGILADLEHAGSCTSRSGYTREKAFAMRPVLRRVMLKSGYMHMTRLNGSEFICWRIS